MWWLLLLVFGLLNPFAVLQQRAEPTGMEATQEVSSSLKVVSIYGVRPDATSDLHVLKVHVELAAGALPLDLARLVIRHSDGVETATYAWGPDPVRDDDPAGSGAFAATWIRGHDEHQVMQPGNLVELAFVLPRDLPERTDVRMDLIPETGALVSADFRTPATYSTDLVVTLR